LLNPVLVLFSFLVLLHGCTYAISPTVANKADRTILFEKLQADPEAYKGKLVILGGSILQITSLKKGSLIEVAQKKLDYWGKPERTHRTGGRFFIFYPRFLDPMVYSPGRDITMAGEVLGLSSPLLGDKQYDLPVILSKEFKLWERERRSWDKPAWIDPLYDADSPERKQ
jgi:outer membrane lipoprotein